MSKRVHYAATGQAGVLPSWVPVRMSVRTGGVVVCAQAAFPVVSSTLQSVVSTT